MTATAAATSPVPTPGVNKLAAPLLPAGVVEPEGAASPDVALASTF
ncbi:predicted protein [Plenodomus lingam JN3]|uniref:Predicted protein n=1 Tax=Leptosphaeria maculans (strain JN3 / isolate v23.1.3 / race Av1-4-5-6-7-8) TaxID=985895 RepID=E5A7V8_LEPMJ|nr:predicted protein [Plenodomus lingam JN3]CBX99703.1 predicted protein [Plenodomus lingam JN3]